VLSSGEGQWSVRNSKEKKKYKNHHYVTVDRSLGPVRLRASVAETEMEKVR